MHLNRLEITKSMADSIEPEFVPNAITSVPRDYCRHAGFVTLVLLGL